MTNAQRAIKRKLRVFQDADEIGNVSKACSILGFPVKHFINGHILPEKTKDL